MKPLAIFKFFIDILSWLFIGAVIVLIVFTFVTNGNILTGYRSFTVLSGSMEPSIRISDIILIHRQDQYFSNEVITFMFDNRIVTHRVVAVKNENGQTSYITKGDANRSEDDGQVESGQVLGKVILVIPQLGQFVAFSRSIPGIILLLALPLLGLLLDRWLAPHA